MEKFSLIEELHWIFIAILVTCLLYGFSWVAVLTGIFYYAVSTVIYYFIIGDRKNV